MIVLAIISMCLFVAGFGALMGLAAWQIFHEWEDDDEWRQPPPRRISNAEWRYCDHRRRNHPSTNNHRETSS